MGGSVGTKTQVYYPQTRPRSYSAGSSSISNTNKRCPTSMAMKSVRVNNPRPQYTKTKSIDENKPSSTARYKTELCRPFQDYGFCRYGEKCQFAHGEDDLRSLPRHPKYKTELCRTYHTRGFCPYGSRCHFIHNLDEARPSSEDNPRSQSPTKKTLGFNLPLSPSLDSGISSPDDVVCFSSGSSGVFDFQSVDQSSGSGSDDSDCALNYSPESNLSSSYFDPGPGYWQDPLDGPDQFEYDSLSVGSSSPVKRVSELFDAEPDVSSMMQGLKLDDCPRTLSAHRLPVFDTMLNSKSDTMIGTDWVSGD